MAAPAADTAPFVDTKSATPPKQQVVRAPTPPAKPTPKSPTAQKQETTAPPPPKPQSKPRPAAASIAQAKKQAKGPGRSAAGSGGLAQQTTGDTKKQANLQKQWQAQIFARVARQVQNVRGQGKVTLRLVVNTSGKLRSVSLAKSSQTPSLDARAMSFAKRARPPRAPRKIASGDYVFLMRVEYRR
jgi:protein TonB